MTSYAPIAVTASATLNRSFANTPVVINAAAGLTLTLPAASGTGDVYTIIVGTTVTSNTAVVRVASASDIMAGNAIMSADGGNTSNMWETAADSDTITMDGSTRGGIRGDKITLTDYASGVWQVEMIGQSTGTEATPFSAAVS